MAFWNKHKNPPPQAEPVPVTQAPAAPPAAVQPVQRLLSYRIGNLQGIGRREQQQDAFCFVNAMDVTEIRKAGLLAVMADGMGGMEGGKAASEAVTASLRQDFQQMDRTRDLGAQLRAAVERAGARVFELLHGVGGSTVVACIFYQEQLWFASVGDSALFLLRDGELLRLNREQNVLTDAYLETVRRGSTDPEPARTEPERNALTQFLGMDALDEVDGLLRPMRLHEDDRFLLCSDGVSDIVPHELLRSCMQQPDPTSICAAIDEAVQSANYQYQDNYTALVVQCGY